EPMPGALTLPKNETLTLADRWILTRLHDTIERVTEALHGFDFGGAAETLWRFVWYEFCDWYVEATKLPENAPTRAAVLSFVWNDTMRLLHPIEPFISEEVWHALLHDGATIVTATWPDPLEVPVDREAEAAFSAVIRTAERVRRERAEAGLGPKDRHDDAEALGGVKLRAAPGVLAERYGKDAQRLRGEIERLEKKLANE